jgi:NAD(P)-dependent dehydrogenase (short-subunit alcohol dehydrogenase family)
MFVKDLLVGQRILVTGGGTGLGKSMSRRFAELGADVIICGRRTAVLEATAKEIEQATGRRVAHHTCDIRDAAGVDAMMSRVWQDGPLQGLVNNAAGNFIARAERLSARAFDAIAGIVLHGTAYCTLAVGRRWIESKQPGTILSIVTTSTFTGGPYTAANAAAKAGVLALMKSLAVEWGPKQIRTVAIAPGLFPTKGAWDRLFPPDALPEPQEKTVPLRRMGDHEEFANLCVYLMSKQAGYITGECVVIDGGRWMQGINGNIARTLENWTEDQWERFRAASARQ